MKKLEIDLINSVLKKDNSILAIYIFGSQVKGEPNKYSDIDIVSHITKTNLYLC